MKIHEYQGKELFKRYGVDSCCGGAARVRDAAVRDPAGNVVRIEQA